MLHYKTFLARDKSTTFKKEKQVIFKTIKEIYDEFSKKKRFIFIV